MVILGDPIVGLSNCLILFFLGKKNPKLYCSANGKVKTYGVNYEFKPIRVSSLSFVNDCLRMAMSPIWINKM